MSLSIAQTRLCKSCDTEKPLEDFDTVRGSANEGRGYRYHDCSPCLKIKRSDQQKLYRSKISPERRAKYKRNRKLVQYGLTEEEYENLFSGEIRCAICNGDDPVCQYGKWAIDHDHTTGKVRGLLCGKCNKALGLFNDNMANLERAIAYLEINGA